MGISRSGSRSFRSGDRPTSTRQSSREQGTVLQDVDAIRGQKATYRALGRALLSEAKEVYQKFVQFVSNPSHVSEVV